MGKHKGKRLFFFCMICGAALCFWYLEKISQVVKVPKETETEESRDISKTTDTESSHEEGQAQEETTTIPERIRVLILSDGFESEYQNRVEVCCLEDTVALENGRETVLKAGERRAFSVEETDKTETSVVFTGIDGGDGQFCLLGLKRGYENPVYQGKITLIRTQEGYLVINELSLEDYLKKVLPSEMPASYPMEALKAQAVCARTYAVGQILSPRMDPDIPADVDDSVNYQVYNNQPEDERTTLAVKDTGGMVLTKDNQLVEALYYSTSCGIDLSRNLSEEAVFCAFLEVENETDYERTEPWYRWNVWFSQEELTRLAMEQEYHIGTVTGLTTGEREESGCLRTLTVQGTEGASTIEGEYSIRRFLNPSETTVKLLDGTDAPMLGMLPSAFFYLVPSYEGEAFLGCQVIGGGYGHGKGMSQNGARHMAEDGWDFTKILKYYYGETELNEAFDTGD